MAFLDADMLPLSSMDNGTNMDTSNVSSCISSVSVIISSTYKGVITGEMIASSLAILPNMALMSVIWRVTVFPLNLRLLLSQFSFLLLWLSVGNIVKTSYILTAIPCSFSINQQQCKIFDLLCSSLPLATVNYTLIALCIERMMATLKYRQYDKKGWHKRPYLACALILISQCTAILVNGVNTSTLATDKFVPICENNFMPSTTSPYLAQIYLGTECLATAITIFIFFYNRCIAKSMAINRARYDLASRFLIDQNVQINAIIIPAMALHFLAHIPAFTIGNIKQASSSLDPTTKAWLSRVTVLLRLVYAVIHPILAFHFNAHLKHHLVENSPLGCLLQRIGLRVPKNTQESTPASLGHHGNNLAFHFDHLDKVWLAKPKGKTTSGPSKTAWDTNENESKQAKSTKF